MNKVTNKIITVVLLLIANKCSGMVTNHKIEKIHKNLNASLQKLGFGEKISALETACVKGDETSCQDLVNGIKDAQFIHDDMCMSDIKKAKKEVSQLIKLQEEWTRSCRTPISEKDSGVFESQTSRGSREFCRSTIKNREQLEILLKHRFISSYCLNFSEQVKNCLKFNDTSGCKFVVLSLNKKLQTSSEDSPTNPLNLAISLQKEIRKERERQDW